MYDPAQDRFEMIKSVLLIVTINLNILRSFHCVQVLDSQSWTTILTFKIRNNLKNSLQIDRTILFR